MQSLPSRLESCCKRASRPRYERLFAVRALLGACLLAASGIVLQGCVASPRSYTPGSAMRAIDTKMLPSSADETPARFLSGDAPVYPIVQALDGKSGATVIDYTIGTDGRAHDFHVVSADDPYDATDAIIAVKKWHFAPAMKDGKPVATRVQQWFHYGSRSQ